MFYSSMIMTVFYYPKPPVYIVYILSHSFSYSIKHKCFYIALKTKDMFNQKQNYVVRMKHITSYNVLKLIISCKSVFNNILIFLLDFSLI